MAETTNRIDARSLRRAGFTLVELLAAMAILSLLVGLSLTLVSKAKATANETACQQQLRDIALVLQTYVDNRREGRYPKENGIKFLLSMVKDGYIAGDALKKFACPGTEVETFDPNDPDKKIGSGLTDWDNLNADCTSYAGRANKEFPIRKDKLDQEAIASDDNWYAGQGVPNHGDITFFVYADGHIGKALISNYKDELPEGQDWLPVGPDSPDENLKKLSID